MKPKLTCDEENSASKGRKRKKKSSGKNRKSRNNCASQSGHSLASASYDAAGQSTSADTASSGILIPCMQCIHTQTGHNVATDIPGFYYDKEKKKYFKIQPNQFSKVSHAVTSETIKKKEQEERRVKSLTNHIFSDSHEAGNNLPILLSRRQLGSLSHTKMDRLLTHKKISCMEVKNAQILPVPRTGLDLEHPIVMELSKYQDRILTMWTVKSSLIKYLCTVDVLEHRDKFYKHRPSKLKISLENSPLNIGCCMSSINWTVRENSNNLTIIHTTMHYTGSSDSTARVHWIDSPDEGKTYQVREKAYNIGCRMPWCCTLNKENLKLSVGSEKATLLIDTETRSLWELNTKNSDVFCQVFTHHHPCVLYSGTRKGSVFGHDTRSISCRPISELQMTTSIGSIRLLKDDNRLLISDTNGKIKLWDIRQRRVLVEYCGTKNQYTRIPVHIDEEEHIVYSCDVEGYTRLWCLNTAELLCTVPSPVASAPDCVPSVLFSQNWGNKPGHSALLIGTGNSFHVYKI